MQGPAGIFGSAILEVAIGLIFLYFILSVICSSVTELFASLLKWRANDLEKALRDVLGTSTLFTNVTSHPLITALGHNDGGSRQSQALDHSTAPATPNTSAPTVPGKPAYIPANTFSLALLDSVVNPDGNATRVGVSIKELKAKIATGLATDDEQRVGKALLTLIEDSRDPHALAAHIDAAKSVVDNLPARQGDEEKLRVARLALAPLASLDQMEAAIPGTLGFDANLRDAALQLVKNAKDDLDNAGYSLDRLQRNIENWFDNAMDRMSGVYKRNVQLFVLCVGLIVSVSTGADTLRFATTLFANPTLRSQLVSAASNQTQASPTVTEALNQLAPFSLLFGYNDIPTGHAPPTTVEQANPPLFWFEKVIGLLATTFAVMMGAPFWFQLLQKLVNVRGTGPKPERSNAAAKK